MFRYTTRRLARLHNEDDPTAGGGPGDGGLDIEHAVGDIATSLFGERKDAGNNDDPVGTDGERGAAPAPSPAPSPAPTAAPVASPAPTSEPAGTPAASPLRDTTTGRFTKDVAPTTWTAAAQATWGSLPEPVREEIARRENNMVQGLEQYRTNAFIGQELHKALLPAIPELQKIGVRPQEFVGRLTNTHMFLGGHVQGVTEAQRVEGALKVIESYGLLDQVKAYLGATQGEGTPQAPNPEVKALREQLQQVTSRLSADDQRRATEIRNSLAQEIDTFAKDPANKYFEDVADDMAPLLRVQPELTLKEAYDKAVWANPKTRALLLAEEHQSAIAKAAKEAQEAAERARRASRSNVRSRGHQGSGTAATGSMDDTMQATLAAIKKRQ